MNKEKKVLFASIFFMLIIVSVMAINGVSPTSSDTKTIGIKNYGLCVKNVTTIKNSCFKLTEEFYKDCYNNAKVILNKTLKRETLNLCKIKRKEKSNDCKENFMDQKETCLVYKCDYNNSEKTYVSKSPSECKGNKSLVTCGDGQKKFSDSCGCGCENKPEVKKSCSYQKDLVEKELKNIQTCSNDSDCEINGLGIACSIELCDQVVYNKNADLTKFNQLNSEFMDNCNLRCPMIACSVNEDLIGYCSSGKCKTKLVDLNGNGGNGSYNGGNGNDDTHECTESERGLDRPCTTDFDPVCAYFIGGDDCKNLACHKTYSNGCNACRDPKIISYKKGKCDGSSYGSKVPTLPGI